MPRLTGRFRLLPIVVAIASLMLIIKLGGLWSALHAIVRDSVVIESAQAAEKAAQNEAAAPAADAVPPAPPQASAATGEPSDKAGENDEGEAHQAAGAEKEKEKQKEAAPAPLTQAEIEVLQQLAKRRDELDARDQEMTARAALLQAAEARIDQKTKEMKDLQQILEQLIKTRDEQEEARFRSLVKIYENMKPKDAARIFEELDIDTLLLVTERMKERKLAPVMARMDPGKAKEITIELAQRRQLPAMAAAPKGQ